MKHLGWRFAVVIATVPLVVTGCDWPMFRSGLAHEGSTPLPGFIAATSKESIAFANLVEFGISNRLSRLCKVAGQALP